MHGESNLTGDYNGETADLINLLFYYSIFDFGDWLKSPVEGKLAKLD